MSPYFNHVLVLCHMLWYENEGRHMTTGDFQNLVVVSEIKNYPVFFQVRDLGGLRLVSRGSGCLLMRLGLLLWDLV